MKTLFLMIVFVLSSLQASGRTFGLDQPLFQDKKMHLVKFILVKMSIVKDGKLIRKKK
jgi:hypothetical protein